MVHWASSYFVRPAVICKWVKFLQKQKAEGKLPHETWITSSDNFASWGGGDKSYHNEDLSELIRSVDYVSMHTYPFHDTHYNSAYWLAPENEQDSTAQQRADTAVKRAVAYAISQYQETAKYVHGIAPNKPIHIGETGWASEASALYGSTGSQAADEYKQKRYYDALRTWTNSNGISCFFFEAFDEPWKDAANPGGSENHFGLFDVSGQAKYVLWDLVDQGVFACLKRGGNLVEKSFNGDETKLLSAILPTPIRRAETESTNVNQQRSPGESVTESNYIVWHDQLNPDTNEATYPSEPLKLNIWDGTCGIDKTSENEILITVGTGPWWGVRD